MHFGRNLKIFRWWFQLHQVTLPPAMLFCFCLNRANCGSCVYSQRSRIFPARQKFPLLEMFCLAELRLMYPSLFESHLQNVPLKFWACRSFFFFYFIFIFKIYLFLAALGLCCAWAFSSCGKRGLLIVVASFCCGAQALVAQASVVVAHGLSSCGLRALERRLSSCGARA